MNPVDTAKCEVITETQGAAESAGLLDVKGVAALCQCSTRTVRRLADSGAAPRPVKLGTLVRWRAETGDPMTGIRDWLAAGCPSCRTDRRATR